MTGRSTEALWIFCDGSSGSRWGRPEETAELDGLEAQPAAGAVARRGDGLIVDWAWRTLPAMTNNEAEYAGLLLGIDLARKHRARQATFVLDSEVVVYQMQGRYGVNSQVLRRLHTQACASVRDLPKVRFVWVPRGWNRLADGLTAQAGLNWSSLMQELSERNDPRPNE